ncbi:hypothetical protein GIB67_018335 [Kingdonia uniflora]|uniref:Pectinesterase inhibitor domain-containing protein n=1 Tax=Kingdonia uniflora TaxID=39325 RepID=A0A7J7MJJ9_9MAGN|nr:hypothetical protein GIB67_018335 [Kingdonia uniflora]
MGSLSFFFLLVLLHHSHFITANSDLIKKTCKNTNYYDLCLSSLKANASSSKADTRGLAVIMIGVGMANANGTYTYLSSQLLSETNDTIMKKVLKECAYKYSNANDALKDSLVELDLMSFDYASVQLSAAKDYPNACHNAFKRFPGLAYPKELASHEISLERICDVASSIVNVLVW